MISKFLQILDLQPRISKVFLTVDQHNLGKKVPFFSFFCTLYTLIDHKKKKLTKYIDCYSFFNSTNRYFRCIALHFQLLEYKTKIDSCKVNGYTRIAICNNNSSMTSLLMHTVAHFIRHSFLPKANNHPLK